MRTIKFVFIFLILLAVFLAKSNESSSTLKTVVSKALEGTKGTYAIYIKNLKTEENYVFNGDRVFEPGSLYKLWVMGAIFEKIEKKKLKEDEVLAQRVDVLNQKFGIALDERELTEGIISLAVKNALEQMIAISHNYAAFLLTENVGVSKVKEFLQKNGFKNSDLGDFPKTTVTDIALFFEKLYKGELINRGASAKMVEILKEQKLNDGLPKYLPKGIKIAHKTGDIGWFKHDGGIVFTENENYIIVVMSESEFPIGAQERIASMSEAVYHYFTKNK